MTFVDSIHELAKSQGLTVPQTQNTEKKVDKDANQQLQTLLEQVAEYYKAQLKQSPRAIDYLKQRGLTGVIAAKYHIGYAPDGWQNLEKAVSDYTHPDLVTAGLVVKNESGRRYDRFRDRIMFPIYSQQGQVIGFGGRVINPEDTPKYYNSPETPLFQKGHELYGLFSARRAIRSAQKVLVVEGYMDVVALAQYGIEYAVASLGTATTSTHITKLKRQTNTIVFSFDGDNAGKTAAWRAVNNAFEALTDDLQLFFLFLPDGHDPDTFIREHGKEAFESAIEEAMPLSAFITHHLCEDNPLKSEEDSVRLLNDAEPILQAIKAPRTALFLRKKIADLAKLSTDEMQSLVKLPSLQQSPRKRPQQQQKKTQRLSLAMRYCLLMILQPHLADRQDVEWLSDDKAGALLNTIIDVCLANTESKPAAILHALGEQITQTQLKALHNALPQLEDNLDMESELAGTRAQLKRQMTQQKTKATLAKLNQKSLSELTDEERTLLKNLSGNPSQ